MQGATNGQAVLVLPKAGSSRTIYVPEDLTTLLAAHVEDVGTRGEDRFFFSNGGYLFNRNSAGHYWREAAKGAGLKGFTLHSLRHYFASGLIRAGCDVVTVQRALGHSQPSITLDVYSSLWPDAEDRTRAAAAGMMADVRRVGTNKDGPLARAVGPTPRGAGGVYDDSSTETGNVRRWTEQ